MRVLRKRLDDFRPDLVVIFGDDQYENFVEDIVPPFCVYILGEMASRPFDIPAAAILKHPNFWNEPKDKVFHHRGHRDRSAALCSDARRSESLFRARFSARANPAGSHSARGKVEY